jgi:arylsulfatase A-like enzyme
MPTFCQLAGHQPATDLRGDGVSLAELLLSGKPLPERPIYIAGPGWRAVSLRLGPWKLVTSEKGTNELFHIGRDPSEESNLSDKERDRLKAMLATLAAVRAQDNDSVVK